MKLCPVSSAGGPDLKTTPNIAECAPGPSLLGPGIALPQSTIPTPKYSPICGNLLLGIKAIYATLIISREKGPIPSRNRAFAFLSHEKENSKSTRFCGFVLPEAGNFFGGIPLRFCKSVILQARRKQARTKKEEIPFFWKTTQIL